MLAALVIYFLIEEAIEIRSMGFEYLQSFWNCIDLAVIGVSLIISTKIIINRLQLILVNVVMCAVCFLIIVHIFPF